MNDDRKPKRDVPPAVFSDDPEEELEEKLRRNPHNANSKVDVGSDESMDASDPISIVRPDQEEPAPSSGFPDEDEGESKKGS